MQEKQSFKVHGFQPDPAEVDPSERLVIDDDKIGDGDEAASGRSSLVNWVLGFVCYVMFVAS